MEVEKTSTKQDGSSLEHEFSPASEVVAVRHLGEATVDFTDTTVNIISGTVSHDGFDAAYFAADCPHTKSDNDPTDCMCPVDGVKVFVIRASGDHEEVTVNDGKFATAVLEDEEVTLYLGKYYGVNGNSDCEKVETRDFNPDDSSGDVTFALKNLHCIELPDKTLVDVLEVEGGTSTCGHIDDNSCPAGYDIWIPRSYEHHLIAGLCELIFFSAQVLQEGLLSTGRKDRQD